ncbi:MAG TPA: methionyl-tRNA formyltransferase [Roseiarcus sp.]
MGTSEFAVPTMLEIVKGGHALVAAYTRAPAAGGRRGLELKKTPVHVAADSIGIPVFTPTTLRTTQAENAFDDHAADVAVVAAYGLLLPIPILEAPRLGCVNLHASLLPRWRGAAPIQRAIMAGDAETGVDLMRLEVGLDTGPIAMREVIPIRPEDTTGDLTSRLAIVAAKLAVSALSSMEDGLLEYRDQSNFGICYAHKLDKSEAEIDWTNGAEMVRNQIHALSPAPGARSAVMIGNRKEDIKFFRVQVTTETGAPGTLLSEGMSIACGSGAIRILEGQRSGRASMSGSELLRGAKLAPGVVFTRSSAPFSAPQT